MATAPPLPGSDNGTPSTTGFHERTARSSGVDMVSGPVTTSQPEVILDMIDSVNNGVNSMEDKVTASHNVLTSLHNNVS